MRLEDWAFVAVMVVVFAVAWGRDIRRTRQIERRRMFEEALQRRLNY